ncbi:MAG TPA: Cthe_2314 family HEPN domain-containing protein [Bacteroidales bacterium]|jgi:hypothetical protein|nr:Cthe_2314 family HEPN domain-containing protein [Bacteroidales bacterium]
MRTLNRFEDLDFFKLLLPIMQNYISHQEFDKIITKQTIFEKYNIDVLLSASNITECLDQINHSIDMLSGYKSKKNSVMNRHDYIVFILENFYLRITSIFDRVLRFTNVVFEIGLPEKECKESTIIKNDKIKGTTLSSSMKKLDKYIEKYRYSRNRIAHSESYNEKRLADIQGFYIALESENNKDLERYKFFYKRIADEFVQEKKSELKNVADELEILLREFFDEITPYIKKIGEKYKKN